MAACKRDIAWFSQTVVVILSFCVVVKCQMCGPGLNTPGYTVPNGDITLEHGNDLEILCIVNNPICSDSYNSSSDLTIEMTNITQMTDIVNCSTIRLYIREHPKVSKLLYSCMLKKDGDKKFVCNNIVSVGTKPKAIPAKNFTCRSYNYENLTCTWPIQNTFIQTKYALSYILDVYNNDVFRCPEGNEGVQIPLEKDKRMSCTWTVNTDPMYRSAHDNMTFQLTISNLFGSVVTNYSLQHFKYVIPNKPENLRSEATSEHSIRLTWNLSPNMLSFTGVHHRIKYLVSGLDGIWSEPIIIKNMLKPESLTKRSFRYELTGLKYPHGLYDVRVAMRSALADEWDESLWSENASTTIYTKSKIPDRPPPTNIGAFDISYNSNRSRSINIYWQQLRVLETNGANFTYHIECLEDRDLRPALKTEKSFAKFENVQDRNYTFRIWSKNEVGRSKNYSTIFVPSSMYTSLLRPPSNLMKEDKQKNQQYNLSWERPYNKEGVYLDNYTIFWCASDRERPYPCNGVMNWTVIPKNMTSYTPDFYDKNKIYQFAISANWRGISSGMSWAECTFLEGRGIGKINWVYAKGVQKPTSITVAWKLDCANKIGYVTGFVVSYCPLLNPQTENSECKGELKNKTIDGDARIEEASIDNLTPYTLYKIQVKVRSRNSESDWSNPIMNHTSEMAPTIPRDLTVTFVSNNSIGLTWKKPLEANGNINQYEIRANGEKIAEINNQEDRELNNRTNLTYTIVGLDSYTLYRIEVQGCTVSCSKPAKVVVTTKKGIPGLVRQIGSHVENSTMVISWTPPEKSHGRIDYYEIRMSNSHDKMNVITKNVTDGPKYLMHSCRDNDMNFHVSIRAVNIENGVKLAGNWSQETELPCNQSSRRTLLTIGIVVVVIAFFASMAFLFKKLYDQWNDGKNLDPKIPDSLQAVIETKHHIDDDDHHMPPDDELPMLKKSPVQTRGSQGLGDDSSGLSTGNESTLSSVHSSGGHLSTDSGTEQHSPVLSIGENDNVTLRQRTSAKQQPMKKPGEYVTVSEMGELGRGKPQLTPGTYSMVGVVPSNKKGTPSDYLTMDALESKNPFIQSSPENFRVNPQGYISCAPQELIVKNPGDEGGLSTGNALRQRATANKQKPCEYVTVSDIGELSRSKPQFTPGSYSMVGVVPTNKKETVSDYLTMEAVEAKNPFIQSTSTEHVRTNPQGYVD